MNVGNNLRLVNAVHQLFQLAYKKKVLQIVIPNHLCSPSRFPPTEPWDAYPTAYMWKTTAQVQVFFLG